MEKLKFMLAMGLCVALLLLPLTGMADNPLPTDGNSDGHPWDDGENDEASDKDDDPDTLPDVMLDAGIDLPPNDLGSPAAKAVFSVVTGNWHLFSRFGFWRLFLF